MTEPRYIFVTGGVLSGLGKGITASSIGRLLLSRKVTVSAIKVDPYLNIDAGTMNPFEHGEVYVLDDGAEADLDLGNYERFMNLTLTADHSITTGKVYQEVIARERQGAYLGKTVQIIPHITTAIKDRIKRVAKQSKADVVIIEMGGTVGDIESAPFLEAARQLFHDAGGHHRCLFIHITLIPVLGAMGELKTKPTQHSVKELRSLGIIPDVIVCRSIKKVTLPIRRKISLFCDVPVDNVISAEDARSIYEVPLRLEEQGLTDRIVEQLELDASAPDLAGWEAFVRRILEPKETVQVAMIGKYTDHADAYMSHIEAFNHVTAATGKQAELHFVDSQALEAKEPDDQGKRNPWTILGNADAILVPGGFGDRGIEGKIAAAGFAREHGIPYLGVCLGFQVAVTEFCRNVLDLEGANSTEFDKATRHPVIQYLPEQNEAADLGGTMRLGAHRIILDKGSLPAKLYGETTIYERHRHRYEVNPRYIHRIQEAGLHFRGASEDGVRMEVFHVAGSKYHVGAQFHPELRSRPTRPSPLHRGLIEAASLFAKQRAKHQGGSGKVRKGS